MESVLTTVSNPTLTSHAKNLSFSKIHFPELQVLSEVGLSGLTLPLSGLTLPLRSPPSPQALYSPWRTLVLQHLRSALLSLHGSDMLLFPLRVSTASRLSIQRGQS